MVNVNILIFIKSLRRQYSVDFTVDVFSSFFILRLVQTNGKSRAVSRFKSISRMARPRIAIEINADETLLLSATLKSLSKITITSV